MSGIPPPDLPSGEGESKFADAAKLSDMQSEDGEQAMGLSLVSLGAKDEHKMKVAQEVNAILGY
jgi:hypothetical protein